MENCKVKKFEDPEGNVWKYVFEFENAIAEAVLYRYGSFKERTVMCVSVQSGCPVGCVFCGTGKKFIRNLTIQEIEYQVNYLICEVDNPEVECGYAPILAGGRCEKFQIMFMSMGEPMLNWDNVKKAIASLHMDYPKAQLLISTVGINDRKVLQEIINISKYVYNLGLQFSIHDADDDDRNIVIPFKNKLSLREIRDYGVYWSKQTGKQVYLNYCLSKKSSSHNPKKLNRLKDLFDPHSFAFTFSVICEKEEGKLSDNDLSLLDEVQLSFVEDEYNVRVFDPAGKDTIGGGCGQLWYVQDYFKKHKK